ncbi:hypothetical protein T439DRAFT_195968 [Meredithblackwellia eburnea MCA 4105]
MQMHDIDKPSFSDCTSFHNQKRNNCAYQVVQPPCSPFLRNRQADLWLIPTMASPKIEQAGVAVNQVVSGMSVVCVIYTLNVRRYLREWEEPENDPSMWRGDAPRVPPPPIPVAKKSNNTWLSWQGMRTAGITREDVLTEQSKAFTEASFNDAAFDVLESVEPAQLGPKRKTREFHSTGSGTSMSTTASLQA